jgi:hypothetical protein
MGSHLLMSACWLGVIITRPLTLGDVSLECFVSIGCILEYCRHMKPTYNRLCFFRIQVPASVRVRRESVPKLKPKAVVTVPTQIAPTAPRPPGVVKPVTIDDTYSAFLEDMKLLGAFGQGQEGADPFA